MRMNFLRLGLVSLVVAGVTGCAGEDAQPVTAANASVVLALLNTTLGNLPKSNSAPTLPMTGTTTAATSNKPGVNTMAATTCETISPTTPVDADGDGIAATKTSTFDCSGETAGAYSYTRKGYFKVTDKDDAVAGMIGGLRVDYAVSNFDFTDTSTGDVSRGSYNGYWDYTGDGAGGLASSSDFTGSTYYKGGTAKYETDISFGYTWKWALKPDNAASPWTTGSESFSGEFRVSGSFVKEDASGTHTPVKGSFKLSYYSKDLVYDSACTKWFKTGSIWIDDLNGSSFEIRYACSTAQLYVNGAKSTLWTP